MSPDANEIFSYLLEQIKSEADLTPEKTHVEKEAIRQLRAEERPESDQIVESAVIRACVRLAYPIERIIYLSENKAKEFKEKFGREMEDILKVFKNKEIILYFLYPYKPASKNPYKMNEKIDPCYGIILPENFDEIYEKYKKIYSSDNKIVKREKQGHLIERNSQTGDFYYKNKIINFENKDSIYYLIFECLFENGDLEGFCSYEIVNTYLEKHGHKKYKDKQQISDRIKNGLESLFRFSNLKPDTPNGKELIKKVRGKGLILYNP